MQSVDDLVVCLGECNWHVGRDIDRFDGDHHTNLEGRMVLEKELSLLNPCFTRGEEIVTFTMTKNET